MVKKLSFMLVLILTFQTLVGQQIAQVNTVDINSKALGQKREILIYTPSEYNENLYTYYDVIYVFDSQNRELFDYTHSTLKFLSHPGRHYIVVGITSPYYKKLNYARNNDMLPAPRHTDPKHFFNGYSGNADNFLKYVKDEVIPYVGRHYRTLSTRVAVGHSLSASFLIYSLIRDPNLFDAYFAISPNFAFDKDRLIEDLYHFDFNRIQYKKFLFLSNANEGINYWKDWIPARKKAYDFFRKSANCDKMQVVIKKFPNKNHWTTFPPALDAAFDAYFKYLSKNSIEKFSKKKYTITLEVRVPSEDDNLYVCGNQKALGNWNPSALKMKKKSAYVREITLTVHSPVQLKFTAGDWTKEAVMKKNPDRENITIIPKDGKTYHFDFFLWTHN